MDQVLGRSQVELADAALVVLEDLGKPLQPDFSLFGGLSEIDMISLHRSNYKLVLERQLFDLLMLALENVEIEAFDFDHLLEGDVFGAFHSFLKLILRISL